MDNKSVRSEYAIVDGLNIHYLVSGDGDPVVLLHGWPTSSHLWREIIPSLAKSAMVIAPDLPGFGKSDKPLDVSYTHDFHARILDGFLEALNLHKVSVVLHDIGVPIGLLWAVRNTGKLQKLVVLNSLFYPDGCGKLFYTQKISLFRRALMTVPYPKAPALLKLLLLAIHTAGVRKLVFTRWPGIYMVMTRGVKNKKAMTRETIRSYQAPFSGADGRRILEKTFVDLELDELNEIVENLPTLKIPAHIIYGEDDWILPHLGEESRRLQRDLPHARLTAISDCGHFLQEDQPERLCRLLAEFLRGR
jgi:pimeloyl-ACP methyl ester carboxylesterase